MRRAGLFGKLPAHGDFVARGVAPAERDAIDAWLSASLADAAAALGAEFDDRFDAAPPWRCAAAGRAGALAASVDGAGRRFPVWLWLDGVAAEQAEPAAAACEALIYRALEESWTADRLADEAAAAPLIPSEVYSGAARWWTVDAEGEYAAEVEGERPPALMRAVLTIRETGE